MRTRFFRRLLLTVALGMALLGARSAHAAPVFTPAYDSIPTPTPTTLIRLVQLDPDGYLDAVLASATDPSVFVLRGTAYGSFGPATNVTVGGIPRSLALGDIDLDGDLDLVTANQAANSVSILLGAGDATFGSPATLSETNPRDVALADLDLDGDLDLVVLHNAGGTVTTRLGNGAGSFGIVSASSYTGYDPQAIAVGDLNGDTIPDLVIACHGAPAFPTFDDGGIDRYVGAGNGSFGARIRLQTGFQCKAVAIADVDGDGRNDVCASGPNYTSPGGAVYFGDPGGSLSPRVDLPATFGPADAIAVGDFQADGRRDVVASVGRAILVWSGSGGRAFAPVVAYSGACGAKGVAVADLDGDGMSEIIDAAGGGADLLKNSGGVLGPYIRSPHDAIGLAAADLNQDQKPDLVLPMSNNAVGIYLGHGDGTFDAPYEIPDSPFMSSEALLGDMNGDLVPDLTICSSWPPKVSVRLGIGDGGFGAAQLQPVPVFPELLAQGDLDGDGHLDVAVACQDSVVILLGRGDGTSRARTDLFAAGARGLVIADFDGSGLPDVAAISFSGTLFVWINQGDGLHYAQTIYSLMLSQTFDLEAGDVDGDGALDLVTSAVSSPVPGGCAGTEGKIVFLRGRGDGSFQSPQVLYVPGLVYKLDLADVDLDGRQDVVMANEAGLGILGGNGTMSPGPSQIFGGSGWPVGQAVADFDRDGRPDVAISDFVVDAIALFRNTTATVDVPAPIVTAPWLGRAYPNPANRSVNIAFSMPQASHARLRILDLQGRVVRTLVDSRIPAGPHTVGWDRSSAAGDRVHPGMYFYELVASGFRSMGRVVMIDP